MLDERCGSQGFLQGSQVEGGPNGTVYAAWERYSPDLASRNIQLRASTDLGATFGAGTAVTPVTGIGDGFELQGLFRAFLDLQGLAVDKSTGARRGTVYLTFQDGSARQKPDPIGFCNASPTYCFGDVYLTRSSDGGATWTNARATANNFAPVTGFQDVVVNPSYMGDYIAVAADATGANPASSSPGATTASATPMSYSASLRICHDSPALTCIAGRRFRARPGPHWIVTGLRRATVERRLRRRDPVHRGAVAGRRGYHRGHPGR
jgi:hypothetical protein